ncbi:TolC family outer membrane protein [Mariprofundus sp. EBB-1]|uniref:TolC family outer membrane protein n=1 Tax=Mariprofundus sp. EBB-1 TaxID=2650971 RepID=UPI001379C5D5|nr:TolC family outer membrane protein [Mariprofundus sp. EBB-1]
MLKYIVGLCCFMVLPLSAHAEDLMGLYKAALDADPALRSAEYEGKVSEELHRQSLANFLPNASAQFQTQTTKQKILRSDNAVFGQGSTRYPTTNWTASLTQPLFHLDAWYAYSKTELGEIRSSLELSAARQDLMVRLVEAYLVALESEENYTLAVAERTTLASELNIATVKYASGLLSVSDLRDVEARSAEVTAQVISSQAAVQDALEVLRGMVGISIKSMHPLSKDAVLPALTPMSVDERVSSAVENNYTVQSKAVAVTIAEKESDKQFAQHYPTVDLIARYNRQDTKGSLFGGGSKVDTSEVLLQVDLPLYEGGRTASLTRESLYRVEQARQELEAAHRSVERDIRAGYIQLLSSSEKIDALRKSLEAKRSLYELKREGHRAGVSSMLEKLEAQRDFYIAERDLVASRYDHLLNYVKIRQAAGSLDGQDLKQINSLLAGESMAASTYEKPDAVIVSPLRVAANNTSAEAPAELVVVQTPSTATVPSAPVVMDEKGVAVETPASADKPALTGEDALAALEQWRQAWSKQDLQHYFDSYAPNFKPNAGSLADWKADRRRKIDGKNMIRVNLGDVKLETIEAGKTAKVIFRQYYLSDTYTDESMKQVTFELHGNRWLIVREINI